MAGAFNLQSLSDIKAVCDRFAPLQGRSSPIKGKYTCITSQTPTTVDGVSGGGGSPGSSGTPTGAGSHDFSARSYVVTGVLGLVAAMFGMF